MVAVWSLGGHWADNDHTMRDRVICLACVVLDACRKSFGVFRGGIGGVCIGCIKERLAREPLLGIVGLACRFKPLCRIYVILRDELGLLR